MLALYELPCRQCEQSTSLAATCVEPLQKQAGHGEAQDKHCCENDAANVDGLMRALVAHYVRVRSEQRDGDCAIERR